MKKYLFLFLLSSLFLIIGLFTISDYGINWDSPTRFLRGQALSTYLLTGNKTYGGIYTSPVLIKPGERVSRYSYAIFEEAEKPVVKLPDRPLPQKDYHSLTDGKKISFYQTDYWNGQFSLSLKEIGHLPLMDIFSSFLNKLFFEKLAIAGDIESYQLGNLLISSAGILLVFIFTFEITYSLFASIIAALSLSLFPIFFAEVHFNMKDPIQAVFYTGSIWAFWKWVKDNKKRWGICFILFSILALGVKWNIVFLLLILFIWLFLIRREQNFKNWLNLKLLFFLLLFILLFTVFLTIIWPTSLLNPFEKLIATLNYYWQNGSRTDLIQPLGFVLSFGFNIYPLILVLTQTPEIILVLVGLGLFRVFREKKDNLKTGYLLLLWLILPVLRFTLPHTWFYSGYRQMMEIIPAMAILAGIGGGYLLSRIRKNITIIKVITIIIIILALAIPIFHLHPNENVYFNVLAGGLKGALDKNLVDWTLTYGNIYKQGADWLNENAQSNANLAFLDGSMFAISPLWLRDDISISPHHFSGFDQKGEYIMALFNPLDPPVFAKRFPEKFLEPIHQIKVDGVTLLTIYKNDPKFLNLKFRQEQKMINVLAKPVKGTDRDYFEIDLAKDLLVTKVSMAGNLDRCFEKDNEMFAFKLKSQLKEKIDLKDVYLTNEKRKEDKRIDFLFPAEKASVILIYPLNDQACSLQSKIFFISYMETR